MLKLTKVLIVLTLLILPITAQMKGNSFDWDLSYNSVLEKNNVGQNESISLWLEKYKSPVKRWIVDWKGSPIVSSILIEYPAFHAAEHQTLWLVRTSDAAYYWESTEGREKDQSEEDVKPEIYDAIFKQVSSWQQFKPKPTSKAYKFWPGYMGFLSFFDGDGSKQILITMEDFFVCPKKSCLPGTWKLGRLMAALEPIITPEEERNYKHKSEAEIARLTPEQRIDEVILEESHRTISHEKYRLLLQLYRRRDGLKGSSRLIELIDGYNPKRTKDTRFHSAMRIAEDIDERVIRLRSSINGNRVIQAIERLSTRRRAEGKSDESIDWVLQSTKGVNGKDRDVRDTLWVKYRIKMSDSELLDFSNYLVKYHPTYLSWSERKLITDYSRKSEGHPLRVFIMTRPIRYLHAYRAFKKQNGH